MRITRVIAVSVMAGTGGLVFGLTAPDAQSLKDARPPAEFPPASYSGNQYVDSRGCIYIRAGIDGNTTWVPRVTRSRKQVCGYQPTAVAGTSTAQPQPQSVETITVPQSTAKVVPTPVPVPAPQAAPTPKPVPPAVASAPPQTAPSTRTTTSRPSPTAAPAPVTSAVPAPVVVPRSTAPASAGCSNASAFSQQFINKQGVRSCC